jgi:DNA replication and repair protein RecF
MGVTYSRNEGLVARLNRAPAPLAHLAELFPVQAIDPGIHRLVEEGPTYRRRWLDWGVFHVEPGFVPQWTEFNRVRRQRNATLRLGADTAPWDPQFAVLGEALTEARQRTLQALRPLCDVLFARLVDIPVSLHFHRGWQQHQSLAEALVTHASGDRERGSTGVGPHRFDVALRTDGRSAREVLSRGQQKLLGAAMALAVAQLVALQGPARAHLTAG